MGSSEKSKKMAFLLYAIAVLVIGFIVIISVEALNVSLQLPILAGALCALIFLSRRVLKLEGFFISRSTEHDLARFREENK